jgi:hypothetical protein
MNLQGILLLTTTLILGAFIGSIATTMTLPDHKSINTTTKHYNTEIHKNNKTFNYTTTVYKPTNNNIQAGYISTEYEIEGNDLVVEDIDSCGRIFGSSMQPTMFTGNTACYEEYINQELKEGMIIRFRTGENKYKIHRIQGNYLPRGFVKTKGDNVLEAAEYPSEENITHVVKAVLHTKPS